MTNQYLEDEFNSFTKANQETLLNWLKVQKTIKTIYENKVKDAQTELKLAQLIYDSKVIEFLKEYNDELDNSTIDYDNNVSINMIKLLRNIV